MSDAKNHRKPYSIGHVAKVTGVAISTLRSWEGLGLLAPHKSEGGHRSFSASDVERVHRIDLLRRVDGQSLSSIRRMLEDSDNAAADPVDEPDADRRTVEYSQIGGQVRAMRKEAGLSLRDLSEKTNINVSHLSMFERGAAFLSPARLNAIAEVFQRSLGELLGGTSSEHLPIVRKGSGRMVSTFGPGVSIEQVTVAERLMDVEVWTIEQGRESDGFYAHEGEELIYLLEGELEIALSGREPVTLTPGDSAYFSSRIDHRWKNVGGGKAVALWVNTDTARLASMQFEKRERRLEIGSSQGTGLGEGALNIELSTDAQTFRVIETHTAGHPTRILVEPLEGLDGTTVKEKQRSFEARYDHLRPLLLQEPRGHAGSFGLVPVPSQTADFGAFFITSYGYPDLCGHAVFGYAKALAALGRLKSKTSFSIEMPGATVRVEIKPDNGEIDVILPQSSVVTPEFAVAVDGRDARLQIVDSGILYAIAEAADLGLDLQSSSADEILVKARLVRDAITALNRADELAFDSVLVCQPLASGQERMFLAIDAHRFDRSPGVTAVAARMAQYVAQGRFEPGAVLQAESIFGGRLMGRVTSVVETSDGRLAVVPKISGRAHLNGISTLIVEPDDPMKRGFLV
ncbi:proline racemase family protein [Hoeflea sp. G2-23]|uniref:4-hydroxyproline epimerase n=1 Tax=Hoeflea algicola TaxID=2983763 RepID=A0ABT3ZDB9_9HYPH|nr:proline racemase family protein [Hoeflea algicola]MCY0149643.1 proline racemase family protein [Hoeflea algicola]